MTWLNATMTENADNPDLIASDAPKKKPLSEAQLHQRREAAKKSTGPKTEAGKAVSSRNAWKTGEHSAINKFFQDSGLLTLYKPCLSTCPKFENDNCAAIVGELTKPGGDCKDTQYFVEAFGAIMESLSTGNGAGVHSLLASQMAQAVQVIQQVVGAITQHGVVIAQPVYDKEGRECGHKYIGNPALSHYSKLLGNLNIDFGQLLLTPKEIANSQTDNDKTDAVRDLMSGIFNMGQGGGGPVMRGNTIEGEVES